MDLDSDSGSQKFNRRQLGGLSITLGNAALFANGLIARMHGDSHEIRSAGTGRMVSGLAYMGVGGILMRYGNPGVKRQLETIEEKFAQHLKEQGVPLDADTIAKADHETRKGWFKKIEDFAYDHPVECANVYNLLSASGVLTSGILRWKRGEYTAAKANLSCFGLIAAGTAISVLPKELTQQQVAEQGKEGTLTGAIQKQPLNFAVWPYLAADFTYGAQSLGEYKVAQKLPKSSTYKPWAMAMAGISAFTTATFVMGDLLTGFMSKKVNSAPSEREQGQKELLEFAAGILAKQPPETQKMLVHEAAEYLVKQEGLRMTDFTVADLEAKILAAVSQHGKVPTETAGVGR